jgi:hypothetical protein
VLYVMAAIMAAGALVAVRGLRSGVQEDSDATMALAEGELPPSMAGVEQ